MSNRIEGGLSRVTSMAMDRGKVILTLGVALTTIAWIKDMPFASQSAIQNPNVNEMNDVQFRAGGRLRDLLADKQQCPQSYPTYGLLGDMLGAWNPNDPDVPSGFVEKLEVRLWHPISDISGLTRRKPNPHLAILYIGSPWHSLS
ncbi:unnamed protein product [Choristocarpus tenellus]